MHESAIYRQAMDGATPVIGAEFGLAGVMALVRRVAPLESPVLLLGETGSGKEVIARALHLASARSQGPLVPVACGAIPETLLDCELFGHEKGAFTGALHRMQGRFERAAGGTLFLDEIGELHEDAQVKLLRVLQDRQFERVGGETTLTADVRVIAATHRNLGRMVREGRFREDLWYRLNVFPIPIPPLRQRREDIPALVHYFVRTKARQLHLDQVPEVRDEDLERLQAYAWPGNVRELQNIIERALILHRQGALHFPDLQRDGSVSTSASEDAQAAAPVWPLDDVARAHIQRALQQTHGRIAGPHGAARLLRVNPNTLRSRMRRLGIG
jgi:transcriptional regulator with GAF, ATPase, and Fis domain